MSCNDMSDHWSVILLQMLEFWLCQWHGGLRSHTRAVNAAKCLERKVVGRENP